MWDVCSSMCCRKSTRRWSQSQRGRRLGGDPWQLVLFSCPPGLARQLTLMLNWCNIGEGRATEQLKTNAGKLAALGAVWRVYFDCTSQQNQPAPPSWEVCGEGLQKVLQMVGRMTHARKRTAEANLHEIKWSRRETETKERFVSPSANYRPEPVTVSKWEPARFCPDTTIRAP